jgi:hypothetical protein
MSIEFSRALTAAAGIAAAVLLCAQQAAADNNGITRFAVRNCTGVQVLICTYNKDDSILAIPYDANRIQAGEKKRASCGSAQRCKVFSLISTKDVDKVISPEALTTSTAVNGVTGIVGGIVGGAMMASENGTMAFLPAGLVAGFALGAGAPIAVVKTIDAVNAGKTCEGALKDMRKAISEIRGSKVREAFRDSLKRTLSGSWPKYKNYSFVRENGVPVLVEGDKC